MTSETKTNETMQKTENTMQDASAANCEPKRPRDRDARKHNAVRLYPVRVVNVNGGNAGTVYMSHPPSSKDATAPTEEVVHTRGASAETLFAGELRRSYKYEAGAFGVRSTRVVTVSASLM